MVYGDLKEETAYDNMSYDSSKVKEISTGCNEHILHVLDSGLIKNDAIKKRRFRIAFNGMCGAGNAYI